MSDPTGAHPGSDRRSFLKAAAGAALLPAWFTEECCSQAPPPVPASPNERPRFALIGCGGQGRGIAKSAGRFALWAMGLDRSGPTTVEGKTLTRPIEGGFTAPAEYEVEYTYANGVRHRCISTTGDTLYGSPESKAKPDALHHGVKFEGPEGWIFVTRGRSEASRSELLSEPLPTKKESLYLSNDHMGNFFECIRSRKAPVCEAEVGHRSASVCHLGVIAIRLERKLRWDPAREEFLGDREANEHFR